MEVLHGNAGGNAELWVVLHWPVPVSHDQVTTARDLIGSVICDHIVIETTVKLRFLFLFTLKLFR